MKHLAVISGLVLTIGVPGMADDPTSVGLENMASQLRGDVRVITMGDSYSVPIWGRVPTASLRVWPIPTITAVQGGATQSAAIIRCTASCSPVAEVLASDPQGYQVERDNADDAFFTLPVRGLREIYGGSSFQSGKNGTLFRFQLDDGPMDTGVHGPFSLLGDDLRFRLLFHVASDLAQQVPGLLLDDRDKGSRFVDLIDGVRPRWHLGEFPDDSVSPAIPAQINAAAIDVPLDADDLHRITVSESTPIANSGQYFQAAGGIYYHTDGKGNRASGMYYSGLADDSWSYDGFGCDTAGSDTNDKRFSLAQFTHWLDVTTLDREQPVIFLWYLAPEKINNEQAFDVMTAMIDQASAGAGAVGLTEVHHMLVISHLHSGTTSSSVQQQQDAAFAIAAERTDVAAASIFAATDGVLFNGSNEGNSWLLERGFDAFHFGTNEVDLVAELGGDLLDGGDIHPRNPDAAAFFAAILGDIIRDAGCPADLVVDGVVGVDDLLAIVAGWGSSGGDITGDGLTNVNDILVAFASWGPCWPVQPPFLAP